MAVTTDNDIKPCMTYAASVGGCGVVVCGDIVPGVHRRRRVEARTKRVRRGVARDRDEGNGVGVTPRYWAGLQAAVADRPVSRLRLLEAAHAALVWDSNRLFPVTRFEENDAAAVAGATMGATMGAAAPAAVTGGVVGVWRRHGRGRGVGRWPSPQPAVPSLEL